MAPIAGTCMSARSDWPRTRSVTTICGGDDTLEARVRSPDPRSTSNRARTSLRRYRTPPSEASDRGYASIPQSPHRSRVAQPLYATASSSQLSISTSRSRVCPGRHLVEEARLRAQSPPPVEGEIELRHGDPCRELPHRLGSETGRETCKRRRDRVTAFRSGAGLEPRDSIDK